MFLYTWKFIAVFRFLWRRLSWASAGCHTRCRKEHGAVDKQLEFSPSHRINPHMEQGMAHEHHGPPPPPRKVRPVTPTGGAGRQSPGRLRRREEPKRRKEGAGTGGARQDPGHSHYSGKRGANGGRSHGAGMAVDIRGPTSGGRPTVAELEEPEAETESRRA